MQLMSIGEWATALGVAIITLRRWHTAGKLLPTARTPGGPRRYDFDSVRQGSLAAFLLMLGALSPTPGCAHPANARTSPFKSCAGGADHDRDVNAAKNLESLAVSSTVTVRGEEGPGLCPVVQTKPSSVKRKGNVKPANE